MGIITRLKESHFHIFRVCFNPDYAGYKFFTFIRYEVIELPDPEPLPLVSIPTMQEFFYYAEE